MIIWSQPGAVIVEGAVTLLLRRPHPDAPAVDRAGFASPAVAVADAALLAGLAAVVALRGGVERRQTVVMGPRRLVGAVVAVAAGLR